MATEKTVDLAQAFVVDPIPAGDHLAVLPVVFALFGGALCIMLRRKVEWHPAIAGVVLTVILITDVGLLMRVLENGPVAITMGRWLPPFGITFTVDAVGAVLALTAAIVGLLAVVYATRDIDLTGRRFGFYPLLMLLIAGVSGSFLTGDIFNLYVWFEVMLLSSFGLLVLGNEKKQLDGAVKYAFLNLIATTLFLIATGYLYGMLGTLNMADIAIRLRDVQYGAPIMTLATLYLLAFGMKAAAFPVNFWLPASYHTPRIVVSALFAGLLTKVGVYALLRTMLTLMPTQRLLLDEVILWAAGLTLILGAFGALAQSDIRRLLGFLVISGIGSMMAGIGIGTVESVTGSVLYAVHSILVMTGLYLATGIIERMSGHATLQRLGGLYVASPLLAGLFLVLAFAIAGLPPFSGFWPKVVLVKAALGEGAGWIAAAILVSGLLTTIAVGRVWAHAFWRGGPLGTADGTESADRPQLPENHWIYFGPVTVIVVLVVAIGILGRPLIAVASIGADSLVTGDPFIQSVFPVDAEEGAD